MKKFLVPAWMTVAILFSMECTASAAPVQLNGHWYDIVDGSFTWASARDVAKIRTYNNGMPGHLATINTAAERDLLLNAVAINPGSVGKSYWLGGYQTNSDNEPAGNWAWVTGEAWGFTNWKAGQPNDYGGKEHFLLTTVGTGAAWNDYGPNSLYGYIIEYEDMCPADPDKFAPGFCGCGVVEDKGDIDGDGTPNCGDACPNDKAKTAPGVCGCGVAETGDTDGDGAADCLETCDSDPKKTQPGLCGCGVAETGDTDGDGVADCNETCDSDPKKTQPGVCGCGVADTDSDNDGVLDCQDVCPADPAKKTAAGICGCGKADSGNNIVDSDGDGVINCQDGCPTDAAKSAPGVCGCGVVDDPADGDHDGVANCADKCPADAAKSAPGLCGCGIADTDADGDNTPDCQDSCKNDPAKTVAGICGCGKSDGDSDSDGVADCNDQCPFDPKKTVPGGCGCGTVDGVDTDGDTVFDCVDNAPTIPNKSQGDYDKDGVGDFAEFGPNPASPNYLYDGNRDGTPDWKQQKVASLFSVDGSQYVTVALNSGVFTKIKARGNPAVASSPAGVDFLQGFFDFAIGSLANGGSVVATMYLANGQTPDTGYIYGPTAANAAAHWYEFLFDGGTGGVLTAATNNVVVIHLRDGGRGDSDLAANGVIALTGAPGLIDNDGDGVGNLSDLCPNDAGKLIPGVCGCGTVDSAANVADDDGDQVKNCNETCDNDPAKTEPGVCGCGAPETGDTDKDGVKDCVDACPADPAKTALGLCGCGVADVAPNTSDSDGDGRMNCLDLCPADQSKTAPGQCGCGKPETGDTDNDGALDCKDSCPTDPGKTAAGICGCGVADTDTDADGTPNCNDTCPADPGKTAQGQCGCGVADTDTDHDGTADCVDACDSDPTKIVAGVCGCGVPETGDRDGDGAHDCNDMCPDDAGKVVPDLCGCGVADSNSDGDFLPDCIDYCVNDGSKIDPGECGCGVAETGDRDGDGVADCNELCDNDPGKTVPGLCGCGVRDIDDDGDGTPNCLDTCPTDNTKGSPGDCGCGVPDADTDGDGRADCRDACARDAGKTAPGLCGCGISDNDSDQDGKMDCQDNAPFTWNADQFDSDGDGVGDWGEFGPDGFDPIYDGNGDGIPDWMQDTAASLYDGSGSHYVTVSIGVDGDENPLPGRLLVVAPQGFSAAMMAPSTGFPATMEFPLNLFGFKVVLDAPGQSTAVVFDMPSIPAALSPDAWFKFGPTPANPIPHWYEFTSDGITGAVLSPNRAVLYLTDGLRGDGSGVDGVILDPGGFVTRDRDGDGVKDGADNCPDDSNSGQEDADHDGVGNACDVCPAAADVDSDADGTLDCLDSCPTDQAKTVPGICGCNKGEDFTDADNDGVAGCNDGCPTDPLKTTAGQCGCGVAENTGDSDADGAINCKDACPADPAKSAPGVCGCGVADTDTDHDGTPNCNDTCPADPAKTAPGICGCGRIEDLTGADTDQDGVPNCSDDCPLDAAKTVPGQCGCGMVESNTDSDGDGVINCKDACPADATKSAPGVCGCGVADTDSDHDGMVDCLDLCPTDPAKTALGQCGCGAADIDTDNDTILDCLDNCPATANQNQLDTDHDGLGDVCDVALDPGVYIMEVHFDQNTNEQEFVELLAVGQGFDLAGWKLIDQDTETYIFDKAQDPRFPCDSFNLAAGERAVIWQGKGVSVCTGPVRNIYMNSAVFLQRGGDDLSLIDKTGVCRNYVAYKSGSTVNPPPAGCTWVGPNPDNGGVRGKSLSRFEAVFANTRSGADWEASGATTTIGPVSVGLPNEVIVDSDGDGVSNGNDGCPADPLKTAAGLCGCGKPEVAGCGNVVDACPADPLKTLPGQCGCGVADTDTDSDGVADCLDGCPDDDLKTAAGACGCGENETGDTDGDGFADCVDACPADSAKTDPGLCGCGKVDVAGCGNVADACPADPLKTVPGQCGCGVADTDFDADGVADCLDGCPDDDLKTAAGACGCGESETGDTDGDGLADCVDAWPTDPNNGAVVDTDHDGVPDTTDGCPTDAAKTAPGQCGCGAADTDTDADGVANCHDNCPNASNPGQEDGNGNGVGNACDVVAPGAVYLNEVHFDQATGEQEFIELVATGGSTVDVSGWKVTDIDIQEFVLPAGMVLNPGERVVLWQGKGVSKHEGAVYHIYANVPVFLSRTGDDVALIDTAGVCRDYVKIKAGDAVPAPAGCAWTGSGVDNGSVRGKSVSRYDSPLADTNTAADWEASGTSTTTGPTSAGARNEIAADTDGDGFIDELDGCPADPLKSAPGTCGCGKAEVAGCGNIDACPADPLKTTPGQCGCGVPETGDFDGDGVADCVDGCPDDDLKIAPGACGCGESETGDTDGDGLADCVDAWPNDPTNGGVVDTDHDGVPDTTDGCPADPLKTAPGQCGCGAADTDTDADGVANCHDNCPNVSNAGQQDSNNNGIGNACDNGVAGKAYINEIHYDQATGEQEFIELVTIGGAVDMSGWKLTDFDSREVIFAADSVLNPGEKVLVWNGKGTSRQEGAVIHLYLGGATFMSSTGDDLALVDAAGKCRDYVKLEDGDLVPNPTPVPADCVWSGAGAYNGGVKGVSVSRLDAPLVDTDTAADWVKSGVSNTTGPLSPGAANVNGGGAGGNTDTDGDGVPDTTDGCPADSAKSAAGQCGCGVADTDSDSDGQANCVDPWPNDPTNGTGSASKLVISEVYYDQASSGGDQEFIELLVAGSKNIDISGWTVKDQDVMTFTFPAGTAVLSPGTRVVVWQGAGINVVTGSVRHFYLNRGVFLSGAGDDVALLDATGACKDYVAYAAGDGTSAPAGCTWAGTNPSRGSSRRSISRLDNPLLDTDNGSDWVASGTAATTGPTSPGLSNQ